MAMAALSGWTSEQKHVVAAGRHRNVFRRNYGLALAVVAGSGSHHRIADLGGASLSPGPTGVTLPFGQACRDGWMTAG
ncbi:MAG: hypothetical protein E7813_23235 [Bradyrhizobium sp.]|uniref:hypothetical protein n=1 Tax=Bradyrhizobium sp. TaxID=376 RepID=UPI001223573E|nr:hypothetical protein [Bradyrhizobium sp.]THD60268.1 MAG: hypothetical protein E7813_23235 [Bradyrhizobium sp.]